MTFLILWIVSGIVGALLMAYFILGFEDIVLFDCVMLFLMCWLGFLSLLMGGVSFLSDKRIIVFKQRRNL